MQTDKKHMVQLVKLPTQVRLELARRNNKVYYFEEEVKLADKIFRQIQTERDYFFTRRSNYHDVWLMDFKYTPT